MLAIRSVTPTLFYFLIFSLLNVLISSGLMAQQAELNPRIRVKNIDFEIGEKNEKVTIELEKFAVPTIFDLSGKQPRIVIDIMNALPWKGRYKIPVNGKLINQIRAYFHKESEKVRIVLDLNPSIDYVVTHLTLTEKILIVLKPIE